MRRTLADPRETGNRPGRFFYRLSAAADYRLPATDYRLPAIPMYIGTAAPEGAGYHQSFQPARKFGVTSLLASGQLVNCILAEFH